MLTRVALIAPPGQSQQRLRAQLSRPLIYSVREFQSMAEVQAGLGQFQFHVLMTRFAKITLAQIPLIEKLRSTFPQAGLVTVSPEIEPQARYLLRKMARHAFIDEELEMQDLDRLVGKVLDPHGTLWARMHPRAQRADLAMVVTTDEKYQENFLFEARFLNHSRMGARLVVHATEQALKLVAKSRIELRYQSSEDPKRVHRFEARVVWIKKTSPLEAVLAGSKTTLGLRFVAEL